MKKLQQGDVLLSACHGIPRAAILRKDTVVAYGEVTNHKHEVVGDGVEVYEQDGTLYLHAPNGGRIQHEEHAAFDIPAGDYTIGIVREYDHFAEEARFVAD